MDGTLYITPKRVVVQGGKGPLWESPISRLTVQSDGTLSINDRSIRWKSKVPVAWWANAILFWKKGIVCDANKMDGPPPSFGDIAELPDVLSKTRWNIRWYNRETLMAEGIDGDIPDTEEFHRVSQHTNMILAALRYDGFHDGPPPSHYRQMLKRYALTHITGLVWGWKHAEMYMQDMISGKGHRAWYNIPALKFANWPDRWHEPKPYKPHKSQWYHQMNPACIGGHPYNMLHQCRTMIPIITKVADELHENPTHNPYLRMRQLFEAIRDDKKLPPPPREALSLARAAANEPW